MEHYHLAQLNLAQAIAPLDDPQMEGFTSRVASVNAIAESSPGFIWRLTDDVHAWDDPSILTNLSVWESAEALRRFTYQGEHLHLFRTRGQWFLKREQPSLVMWWIPRGHRPTLCEGLERLDFFTAHGPTAAAFAFAPAWPRPESPEGSRAVGPPAVNYGGRVFRTSANSENGEAGSETVFRYRQDGARVWATYEGAGVRMGILVAVADATGGLDMRYQHVNYQGVVRSGRCQSSPELLPGGMLRVRESWQWSDSAESGASQLEQIGWHDLP